MVDSTGRIYYNCGIQTEEHTMENTRKIYITVALEILRDANEQEVIAECDYTFEHADIVDTEILGEVEDWVKDYG
jgi:hypothetical protein